MCRLRKSVVAPCRYASRPQHVMMSPPSIRAACTIRPKATDFRRSRAQSVTLEGRQVGDAGRTSDEILLVGNAKQCSHSLFGKVVGEKKDNWLGVKRMMGLLWRMGTSLEVRELNTNYFQFLFPNREAMLRVDRGRSSVFENQYLLLQPWQQGLSEQYPSFGEITLWVQAHGIPINLLSIDVGTKLGRAFKDIKNVNLARAGLQGGRIIRLHITLDANEPLPRWSTIRLGEQKLIVQFKYEKFVSLCFYCGRLVFPDEGGYCQKRTKGGTVR
ncbi:Unknown protein [Striga hermonthica]|uniref:DUF4283 domain-containing protein n=1 Tax=Striga hermonthica TaxID=68872 RepID=A0A9N7NS91_STRHE|nr:Unknown protein [Striga hermonthica]